MRKGYNTYYSKQSYCVLTSTRHEDFDGDVLQQVAA